MSDKILTRTRSWIMNSGLSEGDRLPPERTLCTMLGVTRSELRKSLLLLEAEGLLTRHVGRGTYLARRPGGAGSAASRPQSPLCPKPPARSRQCRHG